MLFPEALRNFNTEDIQTYLNLDAATTARMIQDAPNLESIVIKCRIDISGMQLKYLESMILAEPESYKEDLAIICRENLNIRKIKIL